MGRTATRLALLLALVAVCVVGTGGYTTVSADRTLTAPVADDDPLVSVRACRLPADATAPNAASANATNDTTRATSESNTTNRSATARESARVTPRLRLTVTNRYGRPVAVHVGRDAPADRLAGTVGVGDRARFVVHVERGPIAVRVTAIDLRIELTTPGRRCGAGPPDGT